MDTTGVHSEWLGLTDTLLISDHPAVMESISNALRTVFPHLLKPQLKALVAVNSPMQCMMKEVCAQCLCQHRDPDTKLPSGIVFSCFNQHQPLFAVDFGNLKARQGQNSVQEKVSNLWLTYLLENRIAQSIELTSDMDIEKIVIHTLDKENICAK
jgi:hypothetical protein